ncbi:MAG: DUF4062 domain-containing protein [Candidatus Firestonebacteria bacterium]
MLVIKDQRELRGDRRAIKEFISNNVLLGDYFNVFLFEDLPAKGKSLNITYIKEVDASDIYFGIFGIEYGIQGTNGFSAIEMEYRRAVKKGKEILIFLKGKDDSKRDKKLRDLINEIKKPDSGYVYKRFEDIVLFTAIKPC